MCLCVLALRRSTLTAQLRLALQLSVASRRRPPDVAVSLFIPVIIRGIRPGVSPTQLQLLTVPVYVPATVMCVIMCVAPRAP